LRLSARSASVRPWGITFRQPEDPMQKISPFLWFDTQAEEAANFYVSIFPNARVSKTMRWGEGGPGPAGSVMTIAFELDGQKFTGLNGGPHFKFTEAVSFVIDCADQAEVDRYWAALSEGGEVQQCGWLKDRFGVSWQVVPRALVELAGDPDPVKSARVMAAMMQMVKLDVAGLQRAYDG
jgi:predicted 3-demethylubiquinone-9 3-methyltransferase (glyoxalase superfamily)